MSASVVIILIIEIVFAICYGKYIGKKEERVRKLNTDFRNYYEVVSRWIIMKNSGRKLEEYFKSSGIKNVAIYGAGPLGEMVYQELQDSEINIFYVIDQSKKKFETLKENSIIHPSQIKDMKMPDAIVITPMVHKSDIMDLLCSMNLPASVSFLVLDEIVNYFVTHEVQNEIV